MPSFCLKKGAPMEHVLFVQQVKEDKRKEYINAHREAWPELLRAIKESGIEREMI